jgi:two-component system LytT family response regulator
MGVSSAIPEIGSQALEGLRREPIRVMLAESDAVSCRVIRSVVQDEPDLTLDHVDQTALISSIQARQPEIVILDVHTPVVRRAESWESLGITPPPATIVTAYDASSGSAFASRATRLLLKPFDVEELRSALDLAKLRVEHLRVEDQTRAATLESQQVVAPPQCLQRLAIEEGERIVLVRTADIEWILSQGNQVRIHVGKTPHLLRQSMKKLHALLDPSRFLRVHRNAIVNLDFVEEFHLPAIGNMFVKLRSGVCLPLRKSSRPLLRRLLISNSLNGVA